MRIVAGYDLQFVISTLDHLNMLKSKRNLVYSDLRFRFMIVECEQLSSIIDSSSVHSSPKAAPNLNIWSQIDLSFCDGSIDGNGTVK